jgi:hypothetical protein
MAARSVALLALLALPATAQAGTTDAHRFGRLAANAHASGSITLTLTYEGLPSSGCEEAGTCGVKGTVVSKLKFSPRKRATVPADGIVALFGTGTVEAKVGNPQCEDRLRLKSAGVGFAADRKGVLLQPGAVVAGGTPQDPFDTRCAGPGLLDVGNDGILPVVRLKSVPRDASAVKLTFRDRKEFAKAGYAGSVDVRGRLKLSK